MQVSMPNPHAKRTPPSRPALKPSLMALALGCALSSWQPAAQAFRTTLENGTEVDVASTISFGAQWRLKNAMSHALGNDNGGNVATSAPVGATMNGAGQEASANPDFNVLNADDGNQNFKKGDLVSAALKGTHEVGVKAPDGWRALLRGTWVYDEAAGNTRRTTLSSEARNIAVHNFTLLDAWISKDLKLIDNRRATVKFGNQVLSWGEDIFIVGGINQINAFDLRKLRVPGAQVKEILRPAEMLSLNAGLTDTLSTEMYYQFKWNGFRFDPVGTFFSTADVVGAGQRPAYIPSSSLAGAGLCTIPTLCGDYGNRIQTGVNVVPFEGDRQPPKGGQWGMAFRLKPKQGDTEYAFYYQRYHDKLPFTTLFTDPAYAAYNVANIGYYNEYGANKNLFGTSFNTKVGPVAVGGELSYRPRDSVAIDPSVPLAGRYSIFDPANADANGRITVRGFTEEKKYQGHLTALYFTEVNSPLGQLVKALGAAEGTLLAEMAVTHYPGLKTDSVPYLIFPTYATPTKTSYGYAMEFDLSYPHVWGSAWNLTQVTVFTHDVKGISPNVMPFLQGRKSLYLGMLFDLKSEWKVQAGYSKFFGGGAANLLRDRDNFGVSVSVNF